MKRRIALSIMTLLFMYIFAMAFALADESVTVEDSIVTTDVSNSEQILDQPAVDAAAVQEVVTESESVAPSTQAPVGQQKYAGIAKISYADGHATKLDQSDAEKVRGFWVSVKYVAADPAVVKQIREQYKGQPAKLREELAKLVTDKVTLKSTGRIAIGLGTRIEKFKLVKKEFTNESASFYVMPINENVASLKDSAESDVASKSVGNLYLFLRDFPHLAVWNGTLSLNSGKFAGEWKVYLTGHSVTAAKGLFGQAFIKNNQGAGQVVVNPNANINAAKKTGLLQRLRFWKKAQ